MSLSDVIGAEMTAIMAFIWFTYATACRPVYKGEVLYAQDLPLMRVCFLTTICIMIHQLVFAAWNIHIFGYQATTPAHHSIVRLGVYTALAGFLLYGWALNTIRHYVLPPKSVAPDDEARLIETGPYQFSRNPMYLSYMLVYVGVELVVLSPLALFTPLLLLTFHTWIVEEESDQRKIHSESFPTYCQRVPRWFSPASFIRALRRALYLY